MRVMRMYCLEDIENFGGGNNNNNNNKLEIGRQMNEKDKKSPTYQVPTDLLYVSVCIQANSEINSPLSKKTISDNITFFHGLSNRQTLSRRPRKIPPTRRLDSIHPYNFS